MDYYYIVAALPMLFYDGDIPMSKKTFLEMCEQDLSAAHMDIIRSTSISDLEVPAPPYPALDAWRRRESSLRNELVKLRAQRKGLEAEKHLRETEDVFGTHGTAREAFGEESPLQAEDELDRARWAFLDELEAGHYFDIDRLVLYYLKLQILERRSLFDTEEGTRRFEALISGLSAAKA